MKVLVSAVAFVAMVAFPSFGGNVVWTNGQGDGKWSNPGNWRDGALPVAGDTVYVSNEVANAKLDVDVKGGVSVYALRFEGRQSITLTGEKITLTCASWSMAVPNPRPVNSAGKTSNNLRDYSKSVAAILGYYAGATIYNELEFASTGGGGIIMSDHNLDLYGKVSAPNMTTFSIHNGLAEEKDFDWNEKHPQATPTVSFRGDFIAPKAAVRSMQAVTGPIDFYGKVVIHQLYADNYAATAFGFHTGDVTLGNGALGTHYQANMTAYQANAFPTNAIFFPYSQAANNSDGALSYYLNGYNQTIDRLSGDAITLAKSANVYAGGSAETFLTLRGTANATTSLRLRNVLTLVWDPVDDYTQTFADRVHETTGSLMVLRGTVAMTGASSFAAVKSIYLGAGATLDDASTLAGSLANVGEVKLLPGAKLKFGGSAATPFSGGKADLVLYSGAKVVVPDGATVAVRSAVVDGRPIAAATYAAGEACPWIEGGGSVTVTAPPTPAGTCTYWTADGDGAWEVAANWSDGVPTADRKAVVCKGGDHTITIGQATTMGEMALINDAGRTTVKVAAPVTVNGKRLAFGAGACLEVSSAGEFLYVGDPAATKQTDVISFTDGAKLLVSGGSCSFTNMTGRMVVSAAGRYFPRESGIEVTGGLFSFIRSGDADHGGTIMAYDGAYLDASAGTVLFGTKVAQTWVHDEQPANFRFIKRFSGTAAMRNLNLSSDQVLNCTVFGPGETRFSGKASFSLEKPTNKMIRTRVYATAKEPAEIVFDDDATVGAQGVGDDGIYLFGSANPVNFRWNSSQACQLGNGCNMYNNSHIYLTRGRMQSGMYGISLGIDSGNDSSVEVDGGCLYVNASLRNQGFDGLTLGHGVGATSGKRRGELILRSGAITNANAWSMNLGAGCGATGVFRQYGGDLYTAATKCPTLVGFAGGTGDWRMEGGTATLKGDFWIGGCSTSRYDRLFINYSQQQVIRCPHAEGFGATGTVVVAGGVMRVDNTMYVGAGDYGMLEVDGGSLTVDNLVLSNRTTSIVRFAPVGETCGTLTVNERLTVADGAKLVVDVTGFTGKRANLMTWDSKAGAFAEKDITFIKPDGSEYALYVRDNLVRVSLHTGSVVILR